jgi:hypothetical protein
MQVTKFIALVSAFFWTQTFSASARAADAVFNGEVVSTLGDSSGLAILPAKVSGQGSFVYRSNLDTIGSDSSHGLSFTLNDGGQLKFVAYSNSSLGQGLEFVFSRTGDVVNGAIVAGGDPASAIEISSELSNISASRVINLQLDVHNGESPAHILVWDGL